MKQFYIEVIPKVDLKVIKETLSRVGIRKKDSLFQSCNFISNKDKHYVIHYKEYFSFFSFAKDGKVEEDKVLMTDSDWYRRNNIIKKLLDWNLIELSEADLKYVNENLSPEQGKFFVIKFADKANYKLFKKINV